MKEALEEAGITSEVTDIKETVTKLSEDVKEQSAESERRSWRQYLWIVVILLTLIA